MIIKKFTKTKSGMYKLTLEDDSNINVHEEYILKNNLLLTKKIDNEDVKCVDKINNNFNAYDLAIKYSENKDINLFINKSKACLKLNREKEAIDAISEAIKIFCSK